MRIVSMVLGITMAVALGGCAPATTFNRGVGFSFRPSAKADAQPRVVDSAIELKEDADQQSIKDAGGAYLGDLAVSAEKSNPQFSNGPGGAAAMSGRVSLDVASHGGTHFYLSKNETTSGMGAAPGFGPIEPTQRTTALYVVYRVEPEAWTKLVPKYRPEHRSGEVATAR